MASIISENKYSNADGTAWTTTDKIFGYLDKAGDIYNKIRYPQPGDANYDAYQAQLRAQQMGMFGLPQPFGFILLLGGIGLIGYIGYSVVKGVTK